MFSWLEFEIQGMQGTDYLILFCVLAVVSAVLLYYSHGAFKRFRFMHGTATSKIRSAAQGHVELKGLGEWLPNDSIISPFSQRRCLWYHCTIEKRKRSGKRTTWTNILDQRSEHLFRLVDDTGDCVVDPDDAHVIPETSKTWYGSSPEDKSRPASGSRWNLVVGLGRYRFRERLITPATQLYALGWFHTVRSNPSEEFISKQVEDLVKHWKTQPERYLRQFDIDQNGKIQKEEWKIIRNEARKQVLARIRSEHRDHNVLSKPRESNQPFILSAIDEETLVSRKRLTAYSSAVGAFMLFAALVILYSIRNPLLLT